MRVYARILGVFVGLGLVAGSVAFPTSPAYTIREDKGLAGTSEPMYWIYSSGWPYGLSQTLEAGFDSRDRALEYVRRARERDAAERQGSYVEEIVR